MFYSQFASFIYEMFSLILSQGPIKKIGHLINMVLYVTLPWYLIK